MEQLKKSCFCYDALNDKEVISQRHGNRENIEKKWERKRNKFTTIEAPFLVTLSYTK